ncbi:hypothetical protein AB0F43_12510 [Kribbella sp. NPDC023972]|uniref:hypothetical protein n=1 Tax=Kribbella sp. NPDC023972 TaxID=3154795 RepID=UPI0033EBD4B8
MLATVVVGRVAVGLGVRGVEGLAVGEDGTAVGEVGTVVGDGTVVGVLGVALEALGVTRLDVSPAGPATSAHPTSPAAATTAPTIHRPTPRR